VKRFAAAAGLAFVALAFAPDVFAQNATDTAVTATAKPTPTLDPDDVAMELPGLPPLPDPSTLEDTSNARNPRTPRSARTGSGDDRVLPAVARDDDRRALPENGAETQTFGTTGIALVAAGLAFVIIAARSKRGAPVAVAPEYAHGGPDDTPPWGTESLIGW
jgi:hypothetical protein